MTDGSVAMSEGTMNFAKNYISGVYDYSKAKNAYDEACAADTRNLEYEQLKQISATATHHPDEHKVEEDNYDDRCSEDHQGNTSVTEKGKDKVIAYNSDTESEVGDPRYKVGSRFSQHQVEAAQEEKKNNETQPKENSVNEQIGDEEGASQIDDPPQNNQDEIENDELHQSIKQNVLMESQAMDNEIIKNAETDYNDQNQDTEALEKINFNTMEDHNEEANTLKDNDSMAMIDIYAKEEKKSYEMPYRNNTGESGNYRNSTFLVSDDDVDHAQKYISGMITSIKHQNKTIKASKQSLAFNNPEPLESERSSHNKRDSNLSKIDIVPNQDFMLEHRDSDVVKTKALATDYVSNLLKFD